MIEPKRPRLVTALSVIQMGLAAFYLAGLVQLCYLASVYDVQKDADAAGSIRGLLIGAAFCGAFAFGSVLAALGLWWHERWGRNLALVLLGLMTAALAFGFWDEGDWEMDVLPFLIPCVALLVLYLLPVVSRAFRPLPSS